MNTATINNAFRTLINGTTGTDFPGVAGTNHDVRATIWEQFRATYNERVTVMINGVLVTLKASHSLSGKSTSYICTLSDEQYIKITGGEFGLSKKKDAYITIQFGKVQVHGGGNYFTTIANDKVYFDYE